MAKNQLLRVSGYMEVEYTTASVNTSGTNNGYLNVSKYGRVVTINGVINSKVDGVNLILANVPEGFRPPSDTWLSCGNYQNSPAAMSEVNVKANGDVNFNIPSAQINQDLKIQGTWMTP